MKKLILTVMLVFLSTSTLFSQQGWFLTNAPNTNYQSVFFVNAQTGWATSALNVYKTNDGGASWNVVQYDTSNNVYSKIYFLNENTGWILSYNENGAPACGHIGSTFLTTNGGANWVRKTYEYCSRPVDIYFINANTGFIAHADEILFGGFASIGSISRTTNGGLHWSNVTEFPNNGGEFYKISFKNDLTGYALSYIWNDFQHDTLALFKTTNSGSNWFKFKDITKIAGGRINPYENAMDLIATSDNIYIIGKDSVFLRSTDEGTSWEKIYYAPYKRQVDLYFSNSNTGWTIFKYGTDTTNIMKTTNGGANWFNLRNPFSNNLNSIMFVNDLTGYVAGSGVILKTVTGGVTNVKIISDKIPESFKLQQNYPNPFNGISVIRFSVPQNNNQHIKLTVYNIEGKLIETLVNESIPAGEYEVKWDSKQNASGIYFYKLEANNFSEVKRMVLIK
ncbi:MAG TPA: T9SS type A sorting domain-containing protein [Ignavibacteria bacterium]|nr:T9SS type A sorting domain-containing protein [Ignavibacteria bacterium]